MASATAPVCPRCSAPLASGSSCPDHGVVEALRRPRESTYDAFVEHLALAAGFPTYLPWPMSPGWAVSDFAVVVGARGPSATMTCCSGTSALDGPVDVIIVTEEPGVGLGARIAGTTYDDPGPEIGSGSPPVRVRVEGHPVPLWTISTSSASGEWDRSVVAGEAWGRWLWMIIRPASAILLLRDEWILRDVSGVGPHLVEMGFEGPPPPW